MTNIDIGQRIKTRREQMGMTMQNLADAIGVTKPTIQRYEAGKVDRLKIPVIESIANSLDVNPLWLLGKSEIVDTKKPANDDGLTNAEKEWIKLYHQIPKERQAEYAALLQAVLKSLGLIEL